MNRNLQGKLIAVAAGLVLSAASAVASAGEALDIELPSMRTPDAASTMTREQVRADLLEARSLGTMEHGGDGSTTNDVLVAREMYNQTQTRVILAQIELDERMLAEASAAERNVAMAPDLSAYVEQGADGAPVVVLVNIADDGSITYSSPTDMVAVLVDPD